MARSRRIPGIREQAEWAFTVLGCIVSASAIINLIQSGFAITLSWGFSHFVEYYRQIVTPIVDVIQWPIRAMLSALHVEWTIPQWIKDAHALSFTLAGLYIRGWRRGDRDELEAAHIEKWIARNNPDSMVLSDIAVLERARSRKVSFSNRVTGAAWAIVLAFWYGLTGLILVRWISALAEYATVSVKPVYAKGEASHRTIIRARFGRLMVATIGSAAAVILFYIGNAITPQLGL